jgi:hypothetical protein
MKIPVVSEPMFPKRDVNQSPPALLKAQVNRFNDKLESLPAGSDDKKAELLLEMANTLIDLKDTDQAWVASKHAAEIYIQSKNWDAAAHALDTAYRCNLSGSIGALGQAIWLAVTFPIDIELTVGLLNNIVEETPDDYDAAALAATTAVYLVDLRANDEEYDNLSFFAGHILGQVARRHSGVVAQDAFDSWMKRLHLENPEDFLPRLRNVINVLVQDDWWFNIDEIQSELPED